MVIELSGQSPRFDPVVHLLQDRDRIESAHDDGSQAP